jgi:basic membrane protein A
VLLPVGGPIYQSAVAAIQDSGKDDVLVGVDADLFVTDPTTDALVLTSVEKGIESATKNVIEDAAGGDFNNTAYIGTLKNDGVGIAPFHNFKSKVDSGLQGELDKIKASIISGDLKVTSYLNK